MKYVLLFCTTREQQEALNQRPQEAQQAAFERVGHWLRENNTTITTAHRLQPPHTATTLRFSESGEPLIHDGPFIEGNEIIGGYAEIDVEDLDQALRMAKTWPMQGIVEVRPMVPR